MKHDEAVIEQRILVKGLTAARLSPDAIDATIEKADYYVFPGTTVTVCCLTLKNGFTVVGESACASPANFDTEIGRTIAHSNARDKVWALEGYLLKQELFQSSQVVPE